MIEKTIEKICEQQNGIEDTAAFYVGEQLKDIVRNTPGAAELVLKDLDIAEMSIKECEKKIKAAADEWHKKHGGSVAVVPPCEADGIIRRFYGLPDAGAAEVTGHKSDGLIDLDSFL